ncbi:MAG: HesA/MoeB/ThiF family protein [Bacteroidetes bacterium]|nr:HesA/MoeB/ThiF family protein [Bacteroidota bacterium]
MKLEEIGLVGQLKLKSAKVMVVGAGGLGCPVLLYLTAAGVGKIGIVDFDVVEISNLQRQVLYTVNDIGKHKAEQAVQHLKLRNPYVDFDYFSEKLSVNNALQLFKNYDIIIDGTDNFETRYLINDACVLTCKTLVYGSIQKFAGQVTVFNFPFDEMKRSATYRCLFPEPPAHNTVFNCEDVGVLGILPGLIGTIQATEAIKIITGIGKTLAGELLMIDSSTMNFDSIQFARNESSWKNFPSSPDAFQKFDYSFFCNGSALNSEIRRISAKELRENIQNKRSIQIIDVRNSDELPLLNDERVVRIPINEIRNRISEISKDLPVIVACASGERSAW